MDKKNKKIKVSMIYFIAIGIISVIIFLSPLIMRIPVIYEFVCGFLSALKKVEYKSAYVEIVGAILGTLLAITGAIWTQKISDEHKRKIQKEKNALIIYYDFQFAIDSILNIMNAIYPSIKNNVMPEDELIITKFRKIKRKNHIYINPDWRNLVTSLNDDLSADEIREAQIIYSRLTMISMNLNASVSETSRKEDKNSYSLMYDMISIESSLKEPISYEISANDKISNLLSKIAQIASVEMQNTQTD